LESRDKVSSDSLSILGIYPLKGCKSVKAFICILFARNEHECLKTSLSLLSDRHHFYLKVRHPRCVRSVIQSCSVYISIYTYSHETQQSYITSSDI